jgi:hypothetical protein
MAKPRKRTNASEPAPVAQVGDKVKPGRSEMVYEISRVSPDGNEVNLYVPGTNLQRFRERTDKLTFIERKPPAKTSNPFTTAEPTLDADEVLGRIGVVQQENLKRLDDDIDILKAYLSGASLRDAAFSIDIRHTECHSTFQPKALRRTFLARNKRDLVAATEMPASSAISFTERSFN